MADTRRLQHRGQPRAIADAPDQGAAPAVILDAGRDCYCDADGRHTPSRFGERRRVRRDRQGGIHMNLVTLAQIKRYCGIPTAFTDDDALLTRLLIDAEQWAEKTAQRAFKPI